MKNLRKVFAMLAVPLLACAFIACSDDDDDPVEISEWEYKYQDEDTGYVWDWVLEFYDDNKFELELEVEYGEKDILQGIFAKGSYTGNAASKSATLTLTVSKIWADYDDVLAGTTTSISKSKVNLTETLTATIDTNSMALVGADELEAIDWTLTRDF